ncbi:uncharacterized protein LOC111053268 [Nilaparvata lugens]|uniref:uncharacterized protein LOC111053268 n=1 Tax=Nilaparvata lugens TaxID=108931 RepID=UPI00193DE39F|nr:uncharacterized protein LOC111053268 [Nilaparvata lugens]
MSESLFYGYIDVKVPSRGRKFGPWKAWNKQWCTIRVTSGRSVEICLANNMSNLNYSLTVQVPVNASICRSESRTKSYAFGIFLPESKYHEAVLFLAGSSETESQKWMSQIRALLKPNLIPVTHDEFFVSLIDNKCSRNAGLYGTYGILSLSSIDMTITDSNTGIINASWKWSQIEYAKLAIPAQNDKDSEKILIIRLLSKEVAEDCELQVFCESAMDLESAINRYRSSRQHRLMTSPLPQPPSSPAARLLRLHGSAARRLSRSEGDLRHWATLPPNHNSAALRSSSKCIDDQPSPLGKIAKTLISASIGLILSTPGCSEPDSSRDYQNISTDDWELVEYHDIESETKDLPGLHFEELPGLHFSFPKSTSSNRRESGTSVASGIYEEIEEQSTRLHQTSLKSTETEKNNVAPPPLPPRKTEFYNKM